MKRKMYQAAFPAALIVIMAAFLSTVFFAGATPAFAAASKKKATAVARSSAVETTDARIKQLHVALKITDDQETVWNNFTLVMRENAKEMDAFTKERSESTKTMNAVDHMKFHSQITETQLNHQKKLIPPFEALYAAMSDDQKKITDTLFRTGKHGKHMIK